MNGLTPQYLRDYVPNPRPHLYGTNPTNDLYPIFCRNERFQNSFYPDAVKCWNNIGPELRDAPSLSIFKSQIIALIRPKCQSIFKIHDPVALKYIFQLRVGLSALRAHKHAHNFRDTPTNICACGLESKTTTHFLLKCPYFITQRSILIARVTFTLKDTLDLSRVDDHTIVK